MHTDGISVKWTAGDFMTGDDPVRIANHLMKEYWRRNDDATIIVAG